MLAALSSQLAARWSQIHACSARFARNGTNDFVCDNLWPQPENQKPKTENLHHANVETRTRPGQRVCHCLAAWLTACLPARLVALLCECLRLRGSRSSFPLPRCLHKSFASALLAPPLGCPGVAAMPCLVVSNYHLPLLCPSLPL